ncbi:ATPase [Pseudomonas sp. 8Z]|uniref:ATPase n=1 Tax=Pseudomonas sp. 8Z TaxID=2653166 RepID=UPI0012F40818|nr:ATPase [Pseudomonas sp. 8Z]VXC50049.1 ATPase [Pseudomonas sp. 8Z]
MRNDANDELDNLPSLMPERREEFAEPEDEPAPRVARSASARAPVVKAASTGPLWALVGALSFALAGLGWWSLQQIGLMEQRLVATQESFARISEEAAGRIQDISGKVVATESNVTTGSEALKLQVKQMEARLAELSKQQQQSSAAQAALNKRVEQLGADLKSGIGASADVDKRLQALSSEQATLKAALADAKTDQADLGKLDARIKSLSGDIETLKKQGNQSQAIRSLEQDLVVLRSEMDNRPAAASAGPNTAEFDAFRAQVTRNINTLQSQVVNLQQQIDAR